MDRMSKMPWVAKIPWGAESRTLRDLLKLKSQLRLSLPHGVRIGVLTS